MASSSILIGSSALSVTVISLCMPACICPDIGENMSDGCSGQTNLIQLSLEWLVILKVKVLLSLIAPSPKFMRFGLAAKIVRGQRLDV